VLSCPFYGVTPACDHQGLARWGNGPTLAKLGVWPSLRVKVSLAESELVLLRASSRDDYGTVCRDRSAPEMANSNAGDQEHDAYDGKQDPVPDIQLLVRAREDRFCDTLHRGLIDRLARGR
jgi:hypothetical protein